MGYLSHEKHLFLYLFLQPCALMRNNYTFFRRKGNKCVKNSHNCVKNGDKFGVIQNLSPSKSR